MPKTGELAITKDKQGGKWFLNMSSKISKTGKRSRLKFNTKREAEEYRKTLKMTLSVQGFKELSLAFRLLKCLL